MTEKKYMTASEFILKTRYLEICPENKLHRKILDDFTLKELDKRFIDREELKDKINKLKKEVKYHKGDDITDMILELLK